MVLQTAEDRWPAPFLGMEMHAVSAPALATALEVLAANGVEVMFAEKEEYILMPVISHAIFTYNRGRRTGLADGIVMTTSHTHSTMAASNTICQTAVQRRQGYWLD